MNVPLLGQPRPQQPEPAEPEIIDAITAFYLLECDGGVLVATDVNMDVRVDREPHPHDIIAMARVAQDNALRISLTEHAADAQPYPASTGVIVYKLQTGEVLANTDLDAPVHPDRCATFTDIVGMLENVIRDVDTMSHSAYLAQAVVGAQMQMGQALRQNLEAEKVRQEIEKAKKAVGR